MKSPAYSILRLLRGYLPWDEVKHTDRAPVKSSRTRPALCGAYPPVLGVFLEYTRGMQLDGEPDYKFWRHKFRSLMSGKEEPLLYDSSDAKPPVVGAVFGSGSPSENRFPPPPSLDYYGSLPDSDDDWYPTDAVPRWPTPERVALQDLLGDEQKIVTSTLEMFDESPKMDSRNIYNDDEQTKCGNTGQTS